MRYDKQEERHPSDNMTKDWECANGDVTNLFALFRSRSLERPIVAGRYLMQILAYLLRVLVNSHTHSVLTIPASCFGIKIAVATAQDAEMNRAVSVQLYGRAIIPTLHRSKHKFPSYRAP